MITVAAAGGIASGPATMTAAEAALVHCAVDNLAAADVTVVGGGPAGFAAAITLRNAGAQVLLFEQSRYRHHRVGEILSARVRTELATLGIEKLPQRMHRECVGFRSYWGSAAPDEKAAICDPYGPAWRVDRRAFDEALCAAAIREGVRVIPGHRISRRHLAARTWPRRGCVVDATGRAALVSRAMGARLQRSDRLIAIWRVFPTDKPIEPITLIEATPTGWWYTTTVPSGALIACHFTDADLWRAGATWAAALKDAPSTRRRLPANSGATPPTITAAHTGRLDRVHGPGWIATGDAAQSRDPLSGDGVLTALRSGRLAAQTLIASGHCGPAVFDAYTTVLDDDWSTYLELRQTFYSFENRWADQPFWRRRHTYGDPAASAIPA